VLTAPDGPKAVELLAEAAGRATVLGVAGGDGTVNAAVGLAARAGLPLLVVPAGTLNHFARDVGLESAAEAVAALRAGEAVRVDLGYAGDQVFVNTLSVGAYADLVAARERIEPRLGKWPALLTGVVRVLRHAEPCEIRVDGRSRRVWLLFAGNGRYRPAGLAPSYRTRLDDGTLDIRIVDGGTPFARSRLVASLVTGTLGSCRVYQRLEAQQIALSVDAGPLEFTVDGEVMRTDDRLTVTKGPGALVVYRPATA
jgi:undecaprenyl-diphosphatase